MLKPTLTTTQKALAINIDKNNYGSIAEIGAGQETVGFFFHAGGAAGTVARSMSAYDMAISDSIYGREAKGRYVCYSRLLSMLDHEYALVREILAEKHKAQTKLFSFANTVTTCSFSRPNAEAHGWLGMRFQHEAGCSEPSDVIIHIRLLKGDFLSQQEMVGVVGVNLIYAMFYLMDNAEKAVESLVENISPGAVEIDFVEFKGPIAKNINHHLICLHLVKSNLTHAILFDKNGKIKQPAEVLYKHPTLIQRGSFRPITHVNMDMQQCAVQQFMQESEVQNGTPEILMEITMSNLAADGTITEQDFLDRINLLTLMGYSVLITNFPEHYLFANYLSRNSRSMFAIVVGISNLREVFKEKYYEKLEGGILEACGKLFNRGSKLYIYPEYDPVTQTLHNAANLEVDRQVYHLYQYLLANGSIVDLKNADITKLNIYSRKILEMIQTGQSGWEEFVPQQVVEVIKTNHLWGAR
ncbi:MAG: hypothetical protein KIT27_00785 [Legionellales bacterium]|nr:hypothetical protein [Legionellales bacterium]